MDEVPWYVSLIMAWLPFLFLIALGVWITRTIRATLRTNDGRSLAQALDDHGREMRRANELFEETIKRRLDALEGKS
jgi:hypothetical protein